MPIIPILLAIKSNWKIVIIVFSILSLLWAFYAFCNALIDKGYNKCKEEQRAAQQRHIETTTKKNTELDTGYEKIIKEVIKIPNGCVSNADKRTNQWLRDNYNSGK